MKNLLVILFLTLTLFSCKKDSDNQPANNPGQTSTTDEYKIITSTVNTSGSAYSTTWSALVCGGGSYIHNPGIFFSSMANHSDGRRLVIDMYSDTQNKYLIGYEDCNHLVIGLPITTHLDTTITLNINKDEKFTFESEIQFPDGSTNDQSGPIGETNIRVLKNGVEVSNHTQNYVNRFFVQ